MPIHIQATHNPISALKEYLGSDVDDIKELFALSAKVFWQDYYSANSKKAHDFAFNLAQYIVEAQPSEEIDCLAADLPTRAYAGQMPVTAVTCQDAVDYGFDIDKVGEITKAYISAGGTAFNAIHACAKLGLEVSYMPAWGKKTHPALEQAYKLHSRQLPAESFKPLLVDSDNTFCFITAHDRFNQEDHHFKTPEFQLSEAEQNQIYTQFEAYLQSLDGKSGVILLSDHIPATEAHDYYARIIKLAHQYKQAVFFNPKEYVESTQAQAQMMQTEGLSFIKPNLVELIQLYRAVRPELFSIPETAVQMLELLEKELNEKNSVTEILNIARELMAESSLKIMIVSLGEKGSIFIDKTKALRIAAPQITALSSVAAGDSGIAGFLSQMIELGIDPYNYDDYSFEELRSLGRAFNAAASGSVEQPASNKVTKTRFDELRASEMAEDLV